jgi:predicted nucleotidyltransferase
VRGFKSLLLRHGCGPLEKWLTHLPFTQAFTGSNPVRVTNNRYETLFSPVGRAFFQYPKNRNGIVTETKGIYEVNQIKDALLPLTIKYDINKIILYGSYATGKQEPLSDIDLVVDGNIKGIKFFGLLEDVNNALVKSVDLIHSSQIDHNSEIYGNIMKGLVLYER